MRAAPPSVGCLHTELPIRLRLCSAHRVRVGLLLVGVGVAARLEPARLERAWLGLGLGSGLGLGLGLGLGSGLGSGLGLGLEHDVVHSGAINSRQYAHEYVRHAKLA